MCSTYSPIPKPFHTVIIGRPSTRKSGVLLRAQVTVAPKSSSLHTLPELPKQVISLNDLQLVEIVEKQSRTGSLFAESEHWKPQFKTAFLDVAYERCRKLCAEYAKTFYLGGYL